MAIRDVLAALGAMGDPERRDQLADGHLDDLELDGELDDHERQLVQAAAAGYPGGPLASFTALAEADGTSGSSVPSGRFGAYGEAVRYTDSAYTDPWDGSPELGPPAEPQRATDPDQVVGAPSFASFAQRCLYDEQDGYYGSGRVRFGTDGDFWTYPERMSPLFGAMVAESIRTIVDEWTWAGLLGDDDPLTILELGAGQGRLARDVLDHIADPDTETWDPYRSGLRYVLGDRSPAMRARQARTLGHLVAESDGPLDPPTVDAPTTVGAPDRRAVEGLAEIRAMDAVRLEWTGALRGVLVANELLDALVHECLRVDPDGEVVRVHVVDTPTGRHELEVPLRWGWFDAEGRPGPLPPELGAYLGRALPLVEQVRDTGESAADLWWAPELPRLVADLAEVMRRPGSLAVAMFIDYGDSTIDGIDTDESRLRVYAPDQIHGRDPYRAPGASDLTWDVDFGELGRLAREHGLRVRFAGPQAALEVPPIDLASPEVLDRLVPGREEEGASPGAHALAAALLLVDEFRAPDNGYRVMMLAPADVPFPDNAFGPRQRLG